MVKVCSHIHTKHKLSPIVLFFLLLASCQHKIPQPTCSYSNDIKLIVVTKCALPSCHAQGSSLGDFTDYSVLKSKADNGLIHKYVFDLKIMPPASVSQLTEQQKQTLKCWLDNGAAQD